MSATQDSSCGDADPEHACPLCGAECHIIYKDEAGYCKYNWSCRECCWRSNGGRGPRPDNHDELSHERAMEKAAELAREEAEERFEEGFEIPRHMEIEYHRNRGATIRWDCETPWCDYTTEGRHPRECPECPGSGWEATINP